MGYQRTQFNKQVRTNKGKHHKKYAKNKAVVDARIEKISREYTKQIEEWVDYNGHDGGT